jgi:ATP-dependent helicase/DNAse subunit B
MARKLTSKEYDALSQRIERMADGIAKHKAESGFPNRLDDAARRQWRQKLEDLRSRYEELTSEADRAYDTYANEFKRLSAELSKDDDMLRGFYGKKDAVLADFGTKVQAKPAGRRPKPASTNP